MRVGAYLLRRDDLGRAVALGADADRLGYDSLWITHGLGRDAFLVLAAYAQATRRVGLGTGVGPIYPRHPVAMAQEAATLAEVSRGRFRLGTRGGQPPGLGGRRGRGLGAPRHRWRESARVRGGGGGGARGAGPLGGALLPGGVGRALPAAVAPAAALPGRPVGADAGAGRRAGRRRRAVALRPRLRPRRRPAGPGPG